MFRRSTSLISVLSLCFMFSTPRPARSDVVLGFLAEFGLGYLLGKGVDEIWDPLTGKPNQRKLEERLNILEKNVGTREETRQLIDQLREKINDKVSKAEFEKMAHKLMKDLAQTQSRLDEIEERLEKLEVENQDLRNGTKNAEKADYFISRGQDFQKEKKLNRAIANFNLAVRIENSAKTLNARGNYYLQIGALEIAKLNFNESIKKKETAEAYLGRSELHQLRKDYRNAIWDANKAVSLSKGKLGEALVGKIIESIPDLPQEMRNLSEEHKVVDEATRQVIKEYAVAKLNLRDKLPLLQVPDRKNEVEILQKEVADQEYLLERMKAYQNQLEEVRMELDIYLKLNQLNRKEIDPKEIKSNPAEKTKSLIEDLRRKLEIDKQKLLLEKELQK